MNKSVLWFLTVVSVLAHCSAESIRAISNTSGFAVPHSTQANEHEKPNIQGSDEAKHEERATFLIESFISSVKAADESLPGNIHAVNIVDVPRIKEHNQVLATQMERLEIDIDGVVVVAKALQSAFPDFSPNNVEWMILGKVFFERDESSTDYKVLTSRQLFQELNMEITDYDEIKKWALRLKNNFNVQAGVVFGKMLWLLQHQTKLNLHLVDAAKMAFGSEYLNTIKLPSSAEIVDALGEHTVDKDLVASILRQAKNSRKRKLPTDREHFAIESFLTSVKTVDEFLPRTKHAATMMDVSDIKEHNKVLATRMETLGIDIDGVVIVTKALESAFPDFSLNNVEWMILGKVFFERDESSTDYKVLTSRQLFKELNMEITDYENIKKWSLRLNYYFQVKAGVVFGKMLWLLQHQTKLNLHLADAAKMAFGSEYLNTMKLPSSAEIENALGEHIVDKDLVASILRQAKNSRKRKVPTDREHFAIESLTTSVKTVYEFDPKHAATMMDVSDIKEHNKVLATRMETLGIDIDGVVIVTKALLPEFARIFSLNNVEWMILGKAYFEKAGSTHYRWLSSKHLFKALNMEIIDNEGFKKWTRMLESFYVEPKKVFGKMLWLLQDQKKHFDLDLADAAKMAFGSEYLNNKKFLRSFDKIVNALGEHTVYKDLVESILRQDKDSTMTDRAGDKLLKSTSNYVGEEVHEQSNKKRKLA